MSNAHEVQELTFEQIREAILDASPAALSVVAKDVQWMMTQPDRFPRYDLKQQTLGQWVAACITQGAKYHRDAMERKIQVKSNEDEVKEKAKNMEAFAKFILTQPDIMKDFNKLIAAAVPFKVPIDVLVTYLQKTQQPAASAASAAGAANPTAGATK